MIRLTAVVLLASLAVVPVRPARVGAAAPVTTAAQVVSYAAPVVPTRVVRRFTPPASQYGPGHRGADLAIPAAGVVRAAGPGRVAFAGAVAGRGVVVVEHPDGVRTEYEPLSPSVRAGALVRSGEPIGRLAGQHAGCAEPCLHWGARYRGEYLDPMTLLERLGVVRLLPW